MLEYVLIAIVVGLTALFLIYRFSGSVAGRWKSGAGHVEDARVGGESQTASQAGAGESQSSAQAGGGVPESIPGAAEGEPTPVGSSVRGDGRVHVGNFSFDFSTVLWLGLAVLLVAVLITVRLFVAAKAKPKANVDI